MMSGWKGKGKSFQHGKRVEAVGGERIGSLLAKLFGPVEPIEDEWRQLYRGDYYATRLGLYVEVKTEFTTPTGSLAIETWSNYGWRAGWYDVCLPDVLVYQFLDRPVVYVFWDYWGLQRWLDGPPEDDNQDFGRRLESFREFRQRKHVQRNDSRGHLVPVELALRMGGGEAWAVSSLAIAATY